MNIIMVYGKAGCGKDSFYRIAKHITKTGALRSAFADDVKSIAFDYGWDGNKDTKGRKLLQDVGAVGRAYNKDIWANSVANKIFYNCAITNVTHIITDLRFANEYRVIKEHTKSADKLYVVHIVGRQSDLGNNANDVSEAGLTEEELGTKFITIDNSGTMEEFEANVNKALEEMGL